MKRKDIFWVLLLTFVVFATSYRHGVMSLWLNAFAVEPAKVGEVGKLHDQSATITKLLEAMESTDNVIRVHAFEELVNIGLPVIPFIVNHLKDKSVYVELTRRIMAQQGLTSAMVEQELKSAPSVTDLKIDRDALEKYFYGRYLDALRLFQQEKYEDAKRLTDTILYLEERLAIKDKLKALHVQCDEKILQETILKTELVAAKAIYETGDPVTMTLRLTNATIQPMELLLGPNNPVVLYITLTTYDPFGNYNSVSRMDEFAPGADTLKFNPRETKTFPLVIDTKPDGRPGTYYRIYQIRAEIRPRQLTNIEAAAKLGTTEIFRKISSPEVTLKFFPPDVGPVLKDPLGALQQALAGGVPIDVFLCAMLIPDKDKDKAMEYIFNKLQNEKDETLKKCLLNCLKHITNLPFELDEKSWKDWWKTKTKGNH
ncbi:MAG: hypothetical protein HY762_03095 [Planctomycetes bacterium]|nr:hypothetical protein [Planctomycetota bacterium]